MLEIREEREKPKSRIRRNVKLKKIADSGGNMYG